MLCELYGNICKKYNKYLISLNIILMWETNFFLNPLPEKMPKHLNTKVKQNK